MPIEINQYNILNSFTFYNKCYEFKLINLEDNWNEQ